MTAVCRVAKMTHQWVRQKYVLTILMIYSSLKIPTYFRIPFESIPFCWFGRCKTQFFPFWWNISIFHIEIEANPRNNDSTCSCLEKLWFFFRSVWFFQVWRQVWTLILDILSSIDHIEPWTKLEHLKWKIDLSVFYRSFCSALLEQMYCTASFLIIQSQNSIQLPQKWTGQYYCLMSTILLYILDIPQKIARTHNSPEVSRRLKYGKCIQKERDNTLNGRRDLSQFFKFLAN